MFEITSVLGIDSNHPPASHHRLDCPFPLPEYHIVCWSGKAWIFHPLPQLSFPFNVITETKKVFHEFHSIFISLTSFIFPFAKTDWELQGNVSVNELAPPRKHCQKIFWNSWTLTEEENSTIWCTHMYIHFTCMAWRAYSCSQELGTQVQDTYAMIFLSKKSPLQNRFKSSWI